MIIELWEPSFIALPATLFCRSFVIKTEQVNKAMFDQALNVLRVGPLVGRSLTSNDGWTQDNLAPLLFPTWLTVLWP